ncbi:MAG TPA: DUF4398 domain-containing protein [Woeseiaceae bacterium]|nr:DUF4398 domain-containing protein [Woeseiaceae bacterium]
MTAYVAGFAWRRVCVALVLLAGCGSGPPVQEMSDARQAIAVARDAGAETHAASDLRSAEQYLDSAQRNLHERAYEKAREDALKAKLKALDALAATERPDQRDEH